MAKKKSDSPSAATAEPPPETTSPGETPASDTNGTVPETNGNGGQKPLKVFSYPVAKDSYVQASVWERTVTLKGGEVFSTHELSVRKRLKDAKGEWISVHNFRCSELYALAHAIERAEAFILDLRGANCPF